MMRYLLYWLFSYAQKALGAWAYAFQTFSALEVLGATKMNQLEINVRDHVHGKDSVTPLYHRQQFQVVALTQAGASVAWDLSSGFHAMCTASGNVTVANPSNPVSGMFVSIELRHAVANNSTAWGTMWTFPGSIGPSTSTTSGDRDLIQGWCPDGARIRASLLTRYRGF